METLSEVRKRLVSPPLTSNQISVSEIPEILYKYFYEKRIGEEVKTEVDGEMRVWCELPTINSDQKVILIFTKELDDDVVRTKVALTTWYPPNHSFRDQYDFEILSTPASRGWTSSKGNKFVESLSLKTKCVNIYLVPADHEIADYIAEITFQMRKILISYGNERIVYREFFDGAKRPPR